MTLTTIVKISGEFLEPGSEQAQKLLSSTYLEALTELCRPIYAVGGGNIQRGRGIVDARADTDRVGILASVINALRMQIAATALGSKVLVMAPYTIDGTVAGFDGRKALEAINQKKLLILCGGLGIPFLSTDTAAALRGLELGADLLVKMTKVDAVYSKDPLTYPDAERFDQISYQEVMRRRLQFMDQTAISVCQEHQLPIRVCSGLEPDHLLRIIKGESLGTLITHDSE